MRRTGAGRRLGGIVRDTGWVGASEVVTLLTGLVTLQVLIVGLGPVSYGRYAAVAALAAILTTLSSVWVVLLLLQHTMQDGLSVPDAFAVSLGLAVPAAGVSLVVGVCLGPFLIPTLSLPTIAAFVAADLLSGVFFMVSAAAVQAADGLPAATRVRLLALLTRFVAVLGVGVSGRPSLPLLAACLLAGNAAVGLLVFLRVTRRLGLPRLPRRTRLVHVRQGLPYAGVLASLAVQEDSDKIFLARLADPVDAGLYAAAYKVVQLGFIPVRALVGSSHPRFLVDTAGVRNEHLRRALTYTAPAAAYGVVATLGIVVLAPVIPTVFGSEYDGTLPLLMGLAPLVLLRTLSLFPLNALLGLSRYRLRFLAILGSTLLNLALNAVLIDALSVTGAVLSTLITEVALVVIVWSCVVAAQRRHDKVPVPAPGQ